MPATATSRGSNADGPNGWAEYRRLVLSELERVSQEAAKAVQHGTAIQLALTQAISDARNSLLEKIREETNKVETASDKKIEDTKKELDKKIDENRKDLDKKIEETKKDFETKLQNSDTKNATERTAIKTTQDQNTKNISENAKEISALKAKAMLLGAGAGFLVALAGVLATIFLGK